MDTIRGSQKSGANCGVSCKQHYNKASRYVSRLGRIQVDSGGTSSGFVSLLLGTADALSEHAGYDDPGILFSQLNSSSFVMSICKSKLALYPPLHIRGTKHQSKAPAPNLQLQALFLTLTPDQPQSSRFLAQQLLVGDDGQHSKVQGRSPDCVWGAN